MFPGREPVLSQMPSFRQEPASRSVRGQPPQTSCLQRRPGRHRKSAIDIQGECGRRMIRHLLERLHRWAARHRKTSGHMSQLMRRRQRPVGLTAGSPEPFARSQIAAGAIREQQVVPALAVTLLGEQPHQISGQRHRSRLVRLGRAEHDSVAGSHRNARDRDPLAEEIKIGWTQLGGFTPPQTAVAQQQDQGPVCRGSTRYRTAPSLSTYLATAATVSLSFCHLVELR